MRILKIELIQPGISEKEPIAIIGVFPHTTSNVEKAVSNFVDNTEPPTKKFDEHVKEQLSNCINTCIPIAIKNEGDYITILLKKPND